MRVVRAEVVRLKQEKVDLESIISIFLFQASFQLLKDRLFQQLFKLEEFREAETHQI